MYHTTVRLNCQLKYVLAGYQLTTDTLRLVEAVLVSNSEQTLLFMQFSGIVVLYAEGDWICSSLVQH